MSRLLLSIAALILFAASANAQTITWVGGSGTSWETAVNWSTGVVPGSANDVVIPTGNTVVIGAPANTRSVQVMGNSALTISASLTYSQASSFAAGTTITWSAGSFGGGGTLTNAGSMEVTTASNKGISAATISNTGTINMTGTGTIFFSNGILNNQPTGIFNIPTAGLDFTISGSSTELFNNMGTLNITAAGAVSIGSKFTNSGTINATSGTTTINYNNGVNLNGGTYNVASGAILRFVGTSNVSGTLTGALSGALEWTGSFNVPTTATFNFTGSAGLQWTSGSLTGGGALTNLSTIHLATGANKSLSATTLNNQGIIDFTGNGDLFFSNGIFNNLAAGVLNLAVETGDLNLSSSPNELFTNAGTILRSGAGTASIGVTMTNTGTINVTGGTLSINDGETQFNGGVYHVAAGATLNLNGTTTLSGTLTGNLQGDFNWNNNFVVPIAATFNFSGSNGVNWASGSLSGAGILTNASLIRLTSAADKSIGTATLSNTGVISITSAGDLSFSNGILNNMPTGILNLQADAGNVTFSSSSTELLNNMGTINRTTSTGTASIGSKFTNSGTMTVTAGTLDINNGSIQLNGGTYNVSSGATFDWGGTIAASGTMNGAINGVLKITSNFNVSAAASFNFTGSAPFVWETGNLSGGGTLTNNSPFRLSGAANKNISGGTTLRNFSTVTMVDSGDLLINDGTLRNDTTGIIDVQNDAAVLGASGSGSHVFNNYGIFKKTVQTGVGSGTTQAVSTFNYGTIDASVGTIQFSGPLQNMPTGIIRGTSAITIPPQAADFVNNGTFAPGGTPGNLNVNGNFSSTAQARIAVDINGLTAVTQHDRLAITGSAIMAGQVNVTLGFDATIGNQFIVATTTGTISQCNLAPQAVAIFNGMQYTFGVTCQDNNKVLLTLISRTLAVETFAAEAQKITIAPNPATSFIGFRNSGSLGVEKITVFDLGGRVIKTISDDISNDMEIAINGLSSGIYLLKIETDGGSLTRRFSVN